MPSEDNVFFQSVFIIPWTNLSFKGHKTIWGHKRQHVKVFSLNVRVWCPENYESKRHLKLEKTSYAMFENVARENSKKKHPMLKKDASENINSKTKLPTL